MKRLVALALAALPWAAVSQDMAPNGDLPPVEFRQTDSMSLVIFTSDVGQYCGQSGDPSSVIVACTFLDKGVIVMPNPCPLGERGEHYAKIMCHENAHRLKWRH